MRLTERVAKSVVEAVLRGSVMHYRSTQSHGECDFDVELPHGEWAALEVTASADERELQGLAARRDPVKGGAFVHATQCQRGWLVHPEISARLKNIRQKVDEYLAAIERSGLTEFEAERDAPNHESVQRIWSALRIESGTVLQWTAPNLIGIAPPGRGGVVRRDNIRLALNREAQKKDNATKLSRSAHAQRHLFVVVDPTSQDAWGAMQFAELPSKAPDLPHAISHCWIVAMVGAERWTRVITFSSADGWSDHGWIDLSARLADQ
jgi:hypothetical protein